MKLLIITQRVDRTDIILGFFLEWIREFSKHCESVTVIGQIVGEYDLPDNVRVESLLKEKKLFRPFQIIRFWYLQWRLRKQYDTVLVHMTPIWLVLGSPIWKIFRKKMYLWYEARGGGLPLRIGLRIVRKVFSASNHGMPIFTSKNVILGHGIDVDTFHSGDTPREDGLIVTIGRITSAKRLDFLISKFAKLPPSFRLVIAGVPMNEKDDKFMKTLALLSNKLGISDRFTMEPFSRQRVVRLLQSAEVFVHASDTGLDKAVLEAMACECPVVSCGKAFQNLLPISCRVRSTHFGESLSKMIDKSPQKRQASGKQLRAIIIKRHSLPVLIQRLVKEMETN